MGFCRKLQKIPRFERNGGAEFELGRRNMRGKALCLFLECWLRNLQMDRDELGGGCCERQLGSMQFGSWAQELKDEREEFKYSIRNKDTVMTAANIREV